MRRSGAAAVRAAPRGGSALPAESRASPGARWTHRTAG